MNDKEDCSICLQQIKKRYKIVPCCEKKFHKKCINNWLSNNDTCPLCRSTLEFPPPRDYNICRCNCTKISYLLNRKLLLSILLFIISSITSWICLNSDDENFQVFGLFIGFFNFIFMLNLFYRIIVNFRNFRDRVNHQDLNSFLNEIRIEDNVN